MKQTQHLSMLLGAGLALSMPAAMHAAEAQKVKKAKQPNIIFYLTEDTSTEYLRMYSANGKGAEMPQLEALAKEGFIYDNCYCAGPVSSAARTTLITGCYSPRFDGGFHRKIQPIAMPEGLRMFPTYLRQKGYFTANAKKTDYNVVLDKEAWDILEGKLGDWRKRKDKSQPFFFQRSNMVTHESRLQFKEDVYKTKKTKHDPKDVFIHPYLQDSPLMRYTYATFYDRLQDSDNELAQMVKMLKEDGVLDNTFIFFMGDNGGCLPGTKGYTNDLGFHVPLVVYVPKLWRNDVDKKLGTRVKDFVSFMDLGPQALNMAGVKVPKQMDGKPFLGKDLKGNFIKPPHNANYGFGDRFDELYAFNRTVRTGKFRYARNFQPYHTQSLYALYRYKQLAFAEWKEFYLDGKLNDRQSRFYEPFGAEELYDMENDPYENHNLAKDPKYKKQLIKMRRMLGKYMIQKNDLGFYPETIIYEEAWENPDTYGKTHKQDIKKYLRIANQQVMPWKKAKPILKEALQDKDDVARWWALTTCASFGNKAKSLRKEIKALTQDERNYVRCRALVCLAHQGVKPSNKSIYPLLKTSKTMAEELLILNDYALLLESGLIDPFTLKVSDFPHETFMAEWRMKHINSFSK